MSQERLTAWVGDGMYLALVERSGGVAIGVAREAWSETWVAFDATHEGITRLWSSTNSVARDLLGAYGPSFVSVREFDYQGATVETVGVTRWSRVDSGPSQQEVESIGREAARKMGRGERWEPEPEQPPPDGQSR
jgi:hypothetical protein